VNTHRKSEAHSIKTKKLHEENVAPPSL